MAAWLGWSLGMAAEEIRVLVVDDSAVIRLIAESIAATPGMNVVGAAGDGRQAWKFSIR